MLSEVVLERLASRDDVLASVLTYVDAKSISDLSLTAVKAIATVALRVCLNIQCIMFGVMFVVCNRASFKLRYLNLFVIVDVSIVLQACFPFTTLRL